MLYVLLALPCAAVACHAPVARVEWSYVDAPQTIDNLVVYEVIQTNAQVGILYRGFETRLQERLEACHVHTTVRHGRPDADIADRDAHPVRLTVHSWAGTATRMMSRSDEIVTTKIDGSFNAELYDARVNKLVWRAVIDIKTDSTPDMSDGREFADTMLARMRTDHVIRCPD